MGFLNHLSFELRRRLPALRGGFREAFEGSDEALKSLSRASGIPISVASQMKSAPLKAAASYLWHLQELDCQFTQTPRSLLDLGSMDFAYAVSLALWLRRFNPVEGELRITGLERDPFVLYADLYRRLDAARYYTELAQSADPAQNLRVTYRAEDWISPRVLERASLVTVFFPFLYQDLHRRARLHPRSFNPELFYRKALDSAELGVIFFHQGEQELEDSLRVLDKINAGGNLKVIREDRNPFLTKRIPTTKILWTKNSMLKGL